jgi:hypothetical protein
MAWVTGKARLKTGSGGETLARADHVHKDARLTIAVVACALLGGGAVGLSKAPYLSPEARVIAIRRAQVWKPTDVSAMDIVAGPKGKGSFTPGETVTCEFRDKVMNGRSPKFTCVIDGDDEVKVKYGKDNGEVYGEVAATRLLWALGFGADAMFPVRVVCRNCPRDPARSTKDLEPEVTFAPATIERPMEGEVLETADGSGWAWTDLDLVEQTVGGAPAAHRDALKLLAAMIQHTDNKAEQQRLLCAPGETAGSDGEPCVHTFMMVSDLGLTFGHANLFNRNHVGSVNLAQWSRAPVWANPKTCIADLARSQTGTLGNPRISEAGRSFLAGLLTRLTDAQLQNLFEVARFPERTGPSIRPAGVGEWVAAFRKKRAEIVNHTCPE